MTDIAKLIEPLPIIPLDEEQYTVSWKEAQKIVKAHINEAFNFPAKNIQEAAKAGLEPYKIALAMALNDIGCLDLLSDSNRRFTAQDIEKIEEKFPFLICVAQDNS